MARQLRTKEKLLKKFFPNLLGYTKGCSRLANTRNREGTPGLPVYHGFPGPSRIPRMSESPVLNGASNDSPAAPFCVDIISQSQKILPLRLLLDLHSEFSLALTFTHTSKFT